MRGGIRPAPEVFHRVRDAEAVARLGVPTGRRPLSMPAAAPPNAPERIYPVHRFPLIPSVPLHPHLLLRSSLHYCFAPPSHRAHESRACAMTTTNRAPTCQVPDLPSPRARGSVPARCPRLRSRVPTYGAHARPCIARGQATEPRLRPIVRDHLFMALNVRGGGGWHAGLRSGFARRVRSLGSVRTLPGQTALAQISLSSPRCPQEARNPSTGHDGTGTPRRCNASLHIHTRWNEPASRTRSHG